MSLGWAIAKSYTLSRTTRPVLQYLTQNLLRHTPKDSTEPDFVEPAPINYSSWTFSHLIAASEKALHSDVANH
jgi:hypothetical protein